MSRSPAGESLRVLGQPKPDVDYSTALPVSKLTVPRAFPGWRSITGLIHNALPPPGVGEGSGANGSVGGGSVGGGSVGAETVGGGCVGAGTVGGGSVGGGRVGGGSVGGGSVGSGGSVAGGSVGGGGGVTVGGTGLFTTGGVGEGNGVLGGGGGGAEVAVAVDRGASVGTLVTDGKGVSEGCRIGTPPPGWPPGGRKMNCPATRFSVSRQFARRISATVVPRLTASAPSVSPERTWYRTQNCGGPHWVTAGSRGTRMIIPAANCPSARQFAAARSAAVVPVASANATRLSPGCTE